MASIYIKDYYCISPQKTTSNDFFEGEIINHCTTKIHAIEPNYSDLIPNSILRRMGKGVRMGVGAALNVLKNNQVDGIIIGTANGGLEDCIKFLNQIVDYNEGSLTPTNFVQSTPNSVASTIAISTHNHGYNSTHVNAALAFENAILDAFLLFESDNNYNTVLLGSIEEISDYNYNIDFLKNWIRKENTPISELILTKNQGTFIGEGASMFVVSNKPGKHLAEISDVGMTQTEDIENIQRYIDYFLNKNNISLNEIDSVVLGYNGDNEIDKKISTIEETFFTNQNVFTFKNIFGDFPTSTSLSIYLSINILNNKIKQESIKTFKQENIKNILVVNAYFTNQYSLILLKK